MLISWQFREDEQLKNSGQTSLSKSLGEKLIQEIEFLNPLVKLTAIRGCAVEVYLSFFMNILTEANKRGFFCQEIPNEEFDAYISGFPGITVLDITWDSSDSSDIEDTTDIEGTTEIELPDIGKSRYATVHIDANPDVYEEIHATVIDYNSSTDSSKN